MTLANVSLDDKYTLENGRVFLTGIQALVRLPMMQRQRDLTAADTRTVRAPTFVTWQQVACVQQAA